ncbi:MAG TPA: hypothetical protein VE262_05690 [Blastocatellia bacterium]|nr:hypothetical protein [Blastocatellia bacterium]
MSAKTDTALECKRAVERLLLYCRSEQWSGYDPYDGLNSPFSGLPPLKNKLGRTAWIQLVKRCPVNIRPALGIKKGLNAKGVALALRAVILLSDGTGEALPSVDGRLERDFQFLTRSLAALRNDDYKEACWGYNFDWQSRAFFAPRGTPNVVCTVFAAHAYLDWFERTGNQYAFEMALSSCRFLLDRINRGRGPEGFCFSYTPLDRSRVHNVNLLAAELLARAHSFEPNDEFKDAAAGAARYTVSKQGEDGSWPYGESPDQQWVDSFHTGFILVSLGNLIKDLGAFEWENNLERGFDFYRGRFFLADFTPKYYHDRLYPIDVHSAAQSVITFSEMNRRFPGSTEMAAGAVRWAIENLQSPQGYFYYQRRRLYTNRIPYIRWAQCWMLYALSLHLSRIILSEHG